MGIGRRMRTSQRGFAAPSSAKGATASLEPALTQTLAAIRFVKLRIRTREWLPWRSGPADEPHSQNWRRDEHEARTSKTLAADCQRTIESPGARDQREIHLA